MTRPNTTTHTDGRSIRRDAIAGFHEGFDAMLGLLGSWAVNPSAEAPWAQTDLDRSAPGEPR